jgi:hypothetical protein
MPPAVYFAKTFTDYQTIAGLQEGGQVLNLEVREKLFETNYFGNSRFKT